MYDAATISKVRAQLAEMQDAQNQLEILKLIEEFGEDVYQDGTVMIWTKTYPDNDKIYHNAAIKSGGKWYTTGSSYKQDYAGLVDDIIEGTPVKFADVLFTHPAAFQTGF